jgi:hypothetical protein
MALEKNNSDATFLVVRNGKLAQKVTESTEGATKVFSKDDSGNERTSFYLMHSSLTGTITKTGIYKGNFGEEVKVTIVDGDERYILSFSLKSEYGQDFLKRFPNLPSGDVVKITPVLTEAKDKENNVIKNKEGKTVTRGFISVKDSEGNSIKSFYSKENPLPEWKKVMIDGEQKIDRTAFLEALKSPITNQEQEA